MTGSSSGRARPGAIDFHAHVIVPEVYAVAAQHNVFSELPTDPGVTDEMRRNIKERAATVLARMSDVTERIGNEWLRSASATWMRWGLASRS